jgi:hypothetical protein
VIEHSIWRSAQTFCGKLKACARRPSTEQLIARAMQIEKAVETENGFAAESERKQIQLQREAAITPPAPAIFPPADSLRSSDLLNSTELARLKPSAAVSETRRR